MPFSPPSCPFLPTKVWLLSPWQDICWLILQPVPPTPRQAPQALQAALSKLSLFLPQQSKCAGSKFLDTLCYSQSAHRNMQNPSQKVCLSPSQIFTLLCFNLCHDDIMGYLQRKTFSPGISFLLFLLLLLGCFVVVCLFCFCDGEWFLRTSFDTFFPQSVFHSPCRSLSGSLSLALCVSLPLWFFFASFSLLVSGSRPPLNRCRTQEVWSVSFGGASQPTRQTVRS